MSKEKYRAIVLKSVKYSEHDKILTLFTKEAGKQSAVAKGALSAKSKYIASAQPFCLSEFILSQTDPGKPKYVYTAEVIKGFYAISDELERLCAASYCCELMSEMHEENTKEETAFNLLMYTLDMINDSLPGYGLLYSLTFALKLMGVSGIGLSLNKCIYCEKTSEKYFLDFEAGGIICPECTEFSSDFPLIDDAEARYLNSLLYSDLAAIKKSFLPDKATLVKLLNIINDYHRYATGHKINSFKMLVSI